MTLRISTQKLVCKAILGGVAACSFFVPPCLSQGAPVTAPAELTKPDASANSSPAQPALTPFALGLQLYRSENYPGALEQFTAAGASGPGDKAASYAWAARAALRLKHPEEAAADAAKALELNKNLFTAKSAMGEVYFRQGKFPEAEQAFREILAAKIPDPRSYLGLARLYWATSNHKTAKALIDAAHSLDDKDPDIFWEWVRTLGRQERLTALKERLAAGIDDPEQNAEAQSLVAVLEAQGQNSSRACKLTTNVESTETPLEPLAFDPKHLRGYGLLVKLNDKAGRLLIDTGAGGILINSRLAEKAGVERIGSQDVGGIGDKGPSHGYLALARKIKIGQLEFENCYVDVVDRKSSLDEEGLIGMDVFEDFLVELNFPDRKLRLSPLPPFPDEASQSAGLHSADSGGPNLHNRYIPPEYAKFDRVYRFGHNLLVPTRLNMAPPKQFLLDTGAWDNTVSPAAAREATKVHSDSDTKVKGLSGEVKKVYSADELTLTFSSFQQKREDMVSFDMTHISDGIGTEVSGTLGFAMLYLLDIKIDYRDYLVSFSYDPNRLH
jgi:tetratricopeptide (TPR) repeat protein